MGCLAQIGHKVIGVDINLFKIDALNHGESPIVEKGLDEIIKKQWELRKIEATEDTVYAVMNTDVSFICVGTPSTPEGHLNLAAIFKVAEQIAEVLKSKDTFHIVAIRSTVLPGTNDEVTSRIEKISGKRMGQDFTVVSNPEFLREGSAVDDYYNPPYTLIGSSTEKAIENMKRLYVEIEAPFITVDVQVAEIMKYVNNAFHALKVTFANEIGNICRNIGIDSHKLMDIFCQDTKLNISPYYLKPGFAMAGHVFLRI